jgi:hypothetical protein
MRSALVCLFLAPALCAPLASTGQPADGPAQPVEAWRPASFKASLRYHIDADRTTRHRHYQAMLKKLTAIGFKKEPGWENEELYGDTLMGTTPAATTHRLHDDSHVLTGLLVPAGYDLPADADKAVLVRMKLTSRFGFKRQSELFAKTVKALTGLKFQEAVGYEHLDGQRLMGWLPVGQLDPILKQTLQVQMDVPGKGVLPTEASPPVAMKLNPIELIEVIREPGDGAPAGESGAASAAGRADIEKLSADLRKLIGEGGAEADKLHQVEVILRHAPEAEDGAWRAPLQAGGLLIDGRIGPLVSGQASTASLAGLALLPEVSTVRLPQPARAQPLPPFDPAKPAVDAEFVPLRRFNASPSRLAALIRRHEPQRVAVVASDFRGFEGLLGKQLPRKTSLIDLTSERRADVTTEPAPEPASEIGAGTRLAVLLHATAPADEMLLLRVDASAPYQVEEIARCLSGGRWLADALARREIEVRNEGGRIEERKLDLRVQRRIALDNFGDDKDSVEARENYRKNQAAFDQDEKAFHAKVARLLSLQRNIARLKGLSTVLLGLYWADGHPVLPGERPTLRFIDTELLRGASWVQAIPRLSGQSWSGLFRDENGNGVLEFAWLPGQPLSSAEVNFIRLQPHAWSAAGAREPIDELPASAVVQATLQWREVHAAAWKTRAGDDVFRKPLASFRIVVLRQRDPSGKTLPADLFDVVARSAGLPDRVENDERTGLYQISVRFPTGAQPGRYALRIEGEQPDSTLPPEAGKLPNAERWELQPRLSVDAIDPATRGAGRTVLRHQ